MIFMILKAKCINLFFAEFIFINLLDYDCELTRVLKLLVMILFPFSSFFIYSKN